MAAIKFLVEMIRNLAGFGCRTCGYLHKPTFGTHVNPFDSAIAPKRGR